MSDTLLFLMSKIQHALTTHIKQELQKEDIVLSPGQIGIMLVLERNRKTTMGELSQTLDMDNAAASRLVDKLEKKQMVERVINTSDRRQVNIGITEHGLHDAGIVKGIVRSANLKIQEGFSDKELEIYQRVNQSILKKFE